MICSQISISSGARFRCFWPRECATWENDLGKCACARLVCCHELSRFLTRKSGTGLLDGMGPQLVDTLGRSPDRISGEAVS
ncbi:hypothetical protein RvY_00414 [Ramazzottius varieornatus]|uniref:Uncharacterized protein n=1 Tax=Ramazzottius varieornatus TaxID=947166 RepID=A0A1D1UCP5_RAMVA|nr:hypothetical protein RvY_00414 [Ramazzottius varieornatus]